MAIPILLAGKNEVVGKFFIDYMRPQVETVHYVIHAAWKNELPLLMKSEIPQNPASTIGTGDWTSPPQALLLGGGFSDEDIAEIKQLIASTEGGLRIPILHADPNNRSHPKGGPQAVGPEKYVKEITVLAKAELKRLQDEGKLAQGHVELYKY